MVGRCQVMERILCMFLHTIGAFGNHDISHLRGCNGKDVMKNLQKYFVLLLFLVITPGNMMAQFNFDVESVEALIRDHKRIRSVLMVRDGIEHANQVLHQYSKKAVENHYEVSVNLDEFTRLFDVLDLIANSTTTVMNAANTYTDVKKRINDYKTLLEQYNEKLLLRGNIQPGDTMIISTGTKAIERIYDDGKNIYTSMTAIIAYGSGKVPCNTANLLKIVQNIDESFDDIRKTINSAYMVTWRYIQFRLYYFKGDIYNRRPTKEVSLEALERWKQSSKDALHRRRE